MVSKIVFEAVSWLYEEGSDAGIAKGIIHVSGLTSKNEQVAVKIEDFKPFIYLQLPAMRRRWNRGKCKLLFAYLKQRIEGSQAWKRENRDSTLPECLPESYTLVNRYLLHYSKKVNTMRLVFPSQAGCNDLKYICEREMTIPGLGRFKRQAFIVHESNVDPLIKFSAINKIRLSDWVVARGERVRGDEKFNTSKYNFLVSWKDLKPYTQVKGVYTNIKFCSFDIETYSVNHNSKLPDPANPGNVVFQVAMVFGHFAEDQSNYHKVLITLHDPHDIPGTEVVRCKDERELHMKFAEYIRDDDPELFIGYNIMKFDWHYMLERAKLFGFQKQFLDMSRSLESRASIRKIRWFSNAYGEQVFYYPECVGRSNVDVMLEVQMTFILPKYSLNFVAGKFLGEQKDDITHRQLFMLYQLTDELLPKLKAGCKVSKHRLAKVKRRILQIMQEHHCHGVVDELRTTILGATTKTIRSSIRDALTLTGAYCVQDTILPINLANKLNLWTTMKEMSNVMHTPTTYLHTRGQQVKVLSQMFRETIDRGYIIPHQSKEQKDMYKKTVFQGATVIEAVKGWYENVATLDFASLYPTVMIAFNICFTTIVADDDPIPDELCHVLDWSEHILCKCPKDKRDPKDKKKKRFCADHRYRWRKVIIDIDDEGTITRKFEGILPRMERNLLSTRKGVKKEMAKANARLSMNRGQATTIDIANYKKYGYDVIEKGTLDEKADRMLEGDAGILNAKQMAVKVACNSVGGTTPVPCMVNGEFRYLAIEELFDICGDTPYTEDDEGNQVMRASTGTDRISVWSDKGWTSVIHVMRHRIREPLVRVLTHTGCVDVTPEHSLIRDTGESCTTKELDIGDTLMHNPISVGTYDTSLMVPLTSFTVVGHLNAAKMFQRLQRTNRSVRIIRVVGDEYTLKAHCSPNKTICSTIVSITPLLHSEQYCSTAYIYDIETKNHHFAAGVGDMIVHNSMYGTLGARTGPIPLIEGAASVTAMGRFLIMRAIDRIKEEYSTCKLVYGDTDSCMLHFEGASLAESFALAREASALATHSLKSYILGVDENFTVKVKVAGKRKRVRLCDISPTDATYETLSKKDKISVIGYNDIPIDLEFENMYGVFLLLTKKRYLAYVINENGEIISKTKKGVVSTRRDNSGFLKGVYNGVSDAILDKKSKKEVYQPLYDGVLDLFTGKVPEKDFIIYMGVKTVMGYANKKKVDESDPFSKEYHIDRDGNPIVDVVGPLDPRLVYRNIPQCLLSLKMIGRGTDIPPNSRLEFLYIKNEYATHVGDKAEDYMYYKDNKRIEGFSIDKLHYLEKQLIRPVTELLTTRYPPERKPYESIDDAFKRAITTKTLVGEYRYNLLRNAGVHRTVIVYQTGKLKYVVGWPALKHVSKSRRYMRFVETSAEIANPRKIPTDYVRQYTHRSFHAKAWRIFDSIAQGGPNDFQSKYKADKIVIDTARVWWARVILDRAYKYYGVVRRKEKRPSTACKKVPIGTEVSLLKPVKVDDTLYEEGTNGIVVSMYFESEDKDAAVLHDIEVINKDDETVLLEAVTRSSFTPYISVDGTPIHDMFVMRKSYNGVIVQLDELFRTVHYEV